MADYSTPEVLWAQRSSDSEPEKNFIYLTISASDVPADGLKLDIKPTSVSFEGTSSTLKRKYRVDLELFAEIDPDQSKINHTNKNIEMRLQKKDLKEEYWPRLLKESKKLHFLKTDFDKWVDEDEQDEAPEEDMSQFGGMGGMPGMGGGPGAGGDFGGIDFSKLGGMGGEGGMPDFGSMGTAIDPDNITGGADEDDGDDDGEEEMPPLEEVEDAAAPKKA
ncbi:CS domain [Geosmithia morbida]|uniref:CS domain n=1 Tax=Geosmithia morbida TaxID=1094350 RepID=A0A9P4Z1R8_9HYPO|nr:CS domain [Geosmithia morbida]KAF4125844.1 CS domain [Geosmithia morbida]